MTEYVESKTDETSVDGVMLLHTEGTLEEQKALKPAPTPPSEEEPHTLTAYGDISLTDIDYVPGPPSEISPSQVTRKKESWKRVPQNDSESARRFPSITSRVRPPSFSKGRAKEGDQTFDKLVMELKRDAEKSRSLSKGTSASPRKATPEVGDVQIHSPQPRRLFDLKNFGGGLGVESPTPTKTVDGPIGCEVASGDENGASAPTKPLRGNGKLPKRPPIPRWDVDNDWVRGGAEAPPLKFGIASGIILT